MSITLLSGDCRDVLPTLAANSVHCVVCSPPYYGLRDYGTAQWDGGDKDCDHIKTVYTPASYSGHHGSDRGCQGWRGGERNQSEPYGHVCGKCGARRADRQIGLEATPDEYLATMVAVMREVRRVLRPDGTVWLNVGDSYSGNGTMGRNDAGRNFTGGGGNTLGSGNPGFQGNVSRGAKPKDLLLMPARLALALQADGWWVRSDIIWAKPNPMPESVTDRPTSAYEHVFLLTKRATYFYDAEAVREEASENTHAGYASNGAKTLANADAFGVKPSRFDGYRPPNRNLRNVWTIATQSFPDSHFATFPTALAERCIRAGTSERGCCAACGAPWRREVAKQAAHAGKSWHDHVADEVRGQRGGASAYSGADRKAYEEGYSVTTTGWSASCACKSLRCISCGFVLDTTDAKRVPSTTAHMRSLRQKLPGQEAPDSILQPAMPECRSESAARSDLHSVQDGIPSQSQHNQAVQLGMFQDVDRKQPLYDQGVEHNQQGLQANLAEGSSEREPVWLRDGAPAGDGEEARQASDLGRGSASQERRSVGQSDTQPGADGETSARRASKADISCDLPALSGGVPDARQCPHCGSDTEWATPNTVPATVLDCFAGAGTTLLVADRLQRNAVGVELNTAYTEMAMDRVRADAPLFVATPEPQPVPGFAQPDLFAEAAD